MCSAQVAHGCGCGAHGHNSMLGGNMTWGDATHLPLKLGASIVPDKSVGSRTPAFRAVPAAWAVVKVQPVLGLVPALLFVLMAGLGTWGTIGGDGIHQRHAKQQAANKLDLLANRVCINCLKAGLPAEKVVLALQVQQKLRWPDVLSAMDDVVPALLQASNSLVRSLSLAPAGIVAAAWPELGSSIGLDTFAADPEDLEVVRMGTAQILGPMPLAFGVQGLTVKQPIFYSNVEANETFGFPNVSTIPCAACYNAATRTKFWGFVVYSVSITDMVDGSDSILRKLESDKYAYAFYASYGGGEEVLVAQSSMAMRDPVHASSEGTDGSLQMCTGRLLASPIHGWRSTWRNPVIAGVWLMSLIICGLLLCLLLSSHRHQALLHALVPPSMLQVLQHDARFLVPHSSLTVDTGTAAEKILDLVRNVLEGQPPDVSQAVIVRTAILQNRSIYAPLDLECTMATSNLDSDVASALLQQLGPQRFNARRQSASSSNHPTSGSQVSIHDSSMRYADSSAAALTRAGELGSLQEALLALLMTPGSAGQQTAAGAAYVMGDSAEILPNGTSLTPTANSKVPGSVPRAAAMLDKAAKLFSGSPLRAEYRTCSAGSRPSSTSELPLILEGHGLNFGNPPPPLLEQVEMVLARAEDWQFDTFALVDVSCNHPLSTLGFYLLDTSGLCTRFNLARGPLALFLSTVEQGYKDNPYHNAGHAADVLQTFHVLLTRGGLLLECVDPLTQLACYLAAVIHDFDHQGLTNDFLVSTSDPLAVLYNDRQPNENHHLAAAFALLGRPEMNFLASLDKRDTMKLRTLVVDLVLGTDMKQHFSLISHFTTTHRLHLLSSGASPAPPPAPLIPARPTHHARNNKVQAEHHARSNKVQSEPVDEAAKLLCLQLALKCADLGHIAECRQVHLRWVDALEQELFLQGDRERELGLTISPLFDRTKPGVTKSQVGFFEIVVLPLFKTFSAVYPGAQPLLEGTLANFEYWQAAASADLHLSSPPHMGNTVKQQQQQHPSAV